VEEEKRCSSLMNLLDVFSDVLWCCFAVKFPSTTIEFMPEFIAYTKSP